MSVASGSSGCVCDFGAQSVSVTSGGSAVSVTSVSVTSEGSAVSVASVLRLCLLLGAQAISRELSW